MGHEGTSAKPKSMSALALKAELTAAAWEISYGPTAEIAVIRCHGVDRQRRSFRQPGLPQSFFVPQDVFGTSIRAQHFFEIRNTQRGV